MTGIVVAFLTAAEAQPRDLISDAATALKVGIAILEAYYSEKLVRDWEPFKAVIIDDYWSVSPDRYRPLGLMGGSDPYIEISKKDARVLRMVSIDSRTARAPSPHPSPLRGEGVESGARRVKDDLPSRRACSASIPSALQKLGVNAET
jgi:hypothetical protein